MKLQPQESSENIKKFVIEGFFKLHLTAHLLILPHFSCPRCKKAPRTSMRDRDLLQPFPEGAEGGWNNPAEALPGCAESCQMVFRGFTHREKKNKNKTELNLKKKKKAKRNIHVAAFASGNPQFGPKWVNRNYDLGSTMGMLTDIKGMWSSPAAAWSSMMRQEMMSAKVQPGCKCNISGSRMRELLFSRRKVQTRKTVPLWMQPAWKQVIKPGIHRDR